MKPTTYYMDYYRRNQQAPRRVIKVAGYLMKLHIWQVFIEDVEASQADVTDLLDYIEAEGLFGLPAYEPFKFGGSHPSELDWLDIFATALG